MKVCILGNGLTSLTLAKALVNIGVSTDVFFSKNDKKNDKSRTLGISKSNAYLQYLAYHQGQAGFKTGMYKTKKALLEVAKKTALSKKIFDRQLKKCM